MLSFLRFLRGYVCFIITGTFPQRLINACKSQRIPLWDIKTEKNNITAKTYASKYHKLKSLRKNRNPKFKIKGKYGLPFLLFKFRKRYGLMAGLIFSIAFLSFISQRIWIININTSDPALKESIQKSLDILGIDQGIKSSSMDTKDLKRQLMILEKDLAWDSFNIKGCELDIEVNKKVLSPKEQFHKNKYADIVAECDGQIIYMEIKNGQTLYRKGDTVAKGDILASGTMIDKYGGIRCVYADGRVYALCQKSITAAVPKSERVPVPNGEKYKTYTLSIDKKQYSLTFKKNECESIEIEEKQHKSKFMPHISFIEETFIPVKYKSFILNSGQANKKAFQILAKEEKKLKALKIISFNIKKHEDDNFFYITKDINFIKNIAIIREF